MNCLERLYPNFHRYDLASDIYRKHGSDYFDRNGFRTNGRFRRGRRLESSDFQADGSREAGFANEACRRGFPSSFRDASA